SGQQDVSWDAGLYQSAPSITLKKYVSVSSDSKGNRIWEDANFPTGPIATVCGSGGGYDHDGYDKDGRDKDGRDKDGRDKGGYDHGGYNKSGYKRMSYLIGSYSGGFYKMGGSSSGGGSYGGGSSDKCIDDVFFKFVVTNTGDVPLTNLVLTDVTVNPADKVDVSACVLPSSLAAGSTYTCVVGPVKARAGQHTDTGKVTAEGGSTTVSDTDDANYFGGSGQAIGTGTPGYWKNHPEAWPVDQIAIGGVLYSKAQALNWLSTPDGGDKTITMFRHLISAKLNVFNGTNNSCISSTIALADEWMQKYGPVGSNVGGSSVAWQQGSPLATKLDNYNNGLLCAPHRD
ncbi:MAG: hypothetical protein AABZ84_10965, partial [Pseudomonadota bacterium]